MCNHPPLLSVAQARPTSLPGSSQMSFSLSRQFIFARTAFCGSTGSRGLVRFDALLKAFLQAFSVSARRGQERGADTIE